VLNTIEYEPRSYELRADPYPTYRALLAERPFHWNQTMDAYVAARHADCVRILREPGWSVDRKRLAHKSTRPDAEMHHPLLGLLGLDPPDHTRLRTLVSKTFTPRMIERLRPRVEVLADELLDGIARQRRVDFVKTFAFPLPVTVIAEMLGVPAADWEPFRHWSSVLAADLDPVPASGKRHNTLAAGRALFNYLGRVIAIRRKDPRDDLISDLIAVEEAGDRLSEQELRTLCILLLVAGNETSVGLLANGLLALLRNRTQLERVRDDPSIAESTVEELLRYDSPVQVTSRIAIQEQVIAGRVIAPGEEVFTLLGAANHDPEVFASPERLDVGRDPNPHLAFSRGLHFCLGAPLARLEGQVAMAMLLRRFPGLRLDGEPEWRMTLSLRGVTHLPLSV